MNKAQILYDEYKAKLEALQNECLHEDLSNFNREWSSPGHSTGYSIQVCYECAKIVHRRYVCYNCKKHVCDGEGYKGDGKKHALGGFWCSEACAEAVEGKNKF